MKYLKKFVAIRALNFDKMLTELLRNNRIKSLFSMHDSEDNSLTFDQLTSNMNDMRVLESQSDIIEDDRIENITLAIQAGLTIAVKK